MPRIWHARKLKVRNKDSCVCPHHYKGHSISFHTHLISLNINNYLLTSSFIDSIVLVIFLFYKIMFRFGEWMLWWWHFKSIRNKDFLSFTSTIVVNAMRTLNESFYISRSKSNVFFLGNFSALGNQNFEGKKLVQIRVIFLIFWKKWPYF